MHALVTGATGFLGQYIVEQLAARGDRVRALCRQASPELDALGAETALGDVRDRAAVLSACRGVETVFHVAGVAGIWGPWQHYYATNTLGTEHVIEGCRTHGVARLIYTSSPSVTFAGGDQRNIDERAAYPRRWLCHYPHSKALAEQAVLAANGRVGLATCALRPHLIWGPRDRHLIPRLLDRARRGRLVRVGSGRNLIDMVYVDNAAAAHLLAADALTPDSPVAGKAYFITQGEPVNCWQWIDQLLALAGLAPVERAISYRAAWLAGAALEAGFRLLRLPGEPPMTRFLAAQLGRDHYFDIRRAQQDFGYRPQVSTDVGMQRLKDAANELAI
ncbi:MAG TPA: NAD-dependent epimerase/dehydratase family protein [Pirellulales bacterium]